MAQDTSSFLVAGTGSDPLTGGPVLTVTTYKWDPKEDMTAYEFALCHSILHGEHYLIALLPFSAARHFTLVEEKS